MSAFTEVEASLMRGTQPDAALVLKALWQYRDDMRYAPAADSKQRRIQAINTLLGEK